MAPRQAVALLALAFVAALLGTAPGAVAAELSAEPCFGAAARDAERPCENPALDRAVEPRPLAARDAPIFPCKGLVEDGPLRGCAFGVPAEAATEPVAVVGDSHASGLRPALDQVAQAYGWSGVSLTHASCPLSTAVRDLIESNRFASCARFKRDVFDWFARHPEIRTVFVAGLTGGTGVRPSFGRDRFETAVGGYMDAWNRLPPTVRRIVVVRDSPKSPSGAKGCIEFAGRLGLASDLLCATPRELALDPDPMVAAAARMGSPRVQVVDLTSAYCDEDLCYPVVGGALVHRDTNHLTATFAATLGPQLLRQVRRLPAP